MYTGVSSELQTLILNCILDITSYMSQRYLKFKLNVPKTKIIISFTPQNLVCFQRSWSELIYHPFSSTTQKPIMFDIICLLYYFNISSSSAHFTSSVSLKISTPLHLQHHYHPTHCLTRTIALVSKHPLCFLYIHSGPFQSVLHTLARVTISEYKTNHVTMHILFKNLQMSPCCSWDQDKTP